MATGTQFGRCQRLIVHASSEASSTPSNARQVLGIGPNASQWDVKRAYRRLALEFHPDVCKGEPCEVQFVQVNRAYESLMHRMRLSREAPSSHYEISSAYSKYPPQQRSSEDSDDPWADFLQSLVKPEQSTGASSSSSALEGHW